MTRMRFDRILHRALVPIVAASALLAPVSFTDAQQPGVQIRMATMVPTGSIWDKNLRQMGSEWSRATGGRITITVFPGGAMGDEATLVRKMRFDNPQAAALSVIGLCRIDDAFEVLASPFFYESYDELNHVITALTPTLSARLEQKGLVLLAWGHAGWAYMFTTTPVRTVDDLKQIRIFTSAGDDRMAQWYKSNGFHPVALSANDIPAQLKLTTGMIDTAPSPPYLALVLQIFRDAKYVLDVRLAPLVGGLVISNTAWNKIDAADQKAVLDAATQLPD